MLLLTVVALADDKIHIVVPASYTGDAALRRQPLTLTPTAPLPRTYGTNVFSKQPVAQYTDTNGICTFSNILWGYWRLDIPGNPATSFNLVVGTNLSGLVNVVTLITNTATLPPNPSTNYYTQAQVDSLIAGVSGGTWFEADGNGDLQPLTAESGADRNWEEDGSGNLQPIQ